MNNAHQQQVSASRLPSLMALNYQPDNFHNTIDVGTLSVECSHCRALKFQDQALGNPPETTLTEFFVLCQVDNFAKTLLYVDVPEYYMWNNKSWQRRK